MSFGRYNTHTHTHTHTHKIERKEFLNEWMNEWMNGGNELKGQNPRGIFFFIYMKSLSHAHTHSLFLKKAKFFLFLKKEMWKKNDGTSIFFSLRVCVHNTHYTRAKIITTTNNNKKDSTKKDYSTQSSQVVSNPSTNRARRGLTSLIGREVVLSSWYGRNH